MPGTGRNVRQQLQVGGQARLLLQELDGGQRGAHPFVRQDEFFGQGCVVRVASQFVAQAFDECRIVKQSGSKPQDRLPGPVLLGCPSDHQPVLQCNVAALRPLGHLRQPLAPRQIIRCLLHSRFGHQPGVFEVAVFQKYLVAQGVDLVVKRQAWACLFSASAVARLRCGYLLHPCGAGVVQHAGVQQVGAVFIAHGSRCYWCCIARHGEHHRCCGGNGCLAPLLLQGQAKQPLHVLLGNRGFASGACQFHQHAQHFWICFKLTHFALGQSQRQGRLARCLHGSDGAQVEGFGLIRSGAGVACLQEQVGCLLVGRDAQCFARCTLIECHCAALGAGFVAHPPVHLNAQQGLTQMESVFRQCRQHFGGHLLGHQLMQLHHQVSAQCAALFCGLERKGVVAIHGVTPACPWRRLPVGQVGFPLLAGFVFGNPLRQQLLQPRVVRITAQQVLQVCKRQAGVAAGREQPPLQILARIHEPQCTTDQAGQQSSEPIAREYGPFSVRRR